MEDKMISKNPHERLRAYLNQLPLGFPETRSGVELKILKKLFSESEAELALLLTPSPEETHQIAERNDIPMDGLEEKSRLHVKERTYFQDSTSGKNALQSRPLYDRFV